MNSETKVKQRPILFSTPMVQANLAGRKTVTRRTTGLDYINSLGDKVTFAGCEMGENMTYKPQCPSGLHVFFGNEETDDWWQPIKCPYGNVGDILWVRESFSKTPDFGYVYKASQTPTGEEYRQEYLKAGNKWAKWKPSIHMPYDACRLFLEITDIKVERLQDISEEGAKAEGLACLSKDGGITYKYGIPDADGLPGNDDSGWHWSEWEANPIEAFKKLWKKINGSESWNANPWVWVVSFKRIDKPE